MKNIFVVLISITFFACSKNDETVSIGDEFKLVHEQSVKVKSEELNIQFVDISDSRCPDGSECVWAGEGVVSLKINEKIINVSTLNPTDTLGYTFSIKSLNPYPITDAKIMESDYIVELLVTK